MRLLKSKPLCLKSAAIPATTSMTSRATNTPAPNTTQGSIRVLCLLQLWSRVACSTYFRVRERCLFCAPHFYFNKNLAHQVSVPGVGAGDLQSFCNEESFIWTKKINCVTIYAYVKTFIIRDENQTTVEFRPQNYRRFLRAIKSQKSRPTASIFRGWSPSRLAPEPLSTSPESWGQGLSTLQTGTVSGKNPQLAGVLLCFWHEGGKPALKPSVSCVIGGQGC